MLINILCWLLVIITGLYSLLFIVNLGLWLTQPLGMSRYEFYEPFPKVSLMIDLILIILTYITYCLV